MIYSRSVCKAHRQDLWLKSVWTDGAGKLWVGATDGLICFQGKERVYYGTASGLPDKIITTIFEDRIGQLWVGTYGGLARNIRSDFVTYSQKAGMVPDEALLQRLARVLGEDGK